MVAESGVEVEVVDAFLAELTRRGCGSYTVRAYRYGVRDFGRWLAEQARPLSSVSRADIEDYIDAFARGEQGAGRPPRSVSDPAVVELASGRPARREGRAARTVNHRLSVLATFFEFLAQDGAGEVWPADRVSPVPAAAPSGPRHGRPGGGDAPVRARGDLRRREPRAVARDLDPAVVARLIGAAPSWRDRALLLLLSRSGARIGDWSEQHGRHGVLGMELADLDRRAGTVTVRLKGARDEHSVPVSAPFWSAVDRYLAEERGDPATSALWVGMRRGRGRPLGYAAFEAGLRHLGGKVGVTVSAHMFRHTVATALVEHAGAAVAQRMLGHRHVGTTIDSYVHVDRPAMVTAVAALEERRTTVDGATASGQRYAFHYDPTTLAVLEAIAHPRLAGDAT